MAIVTIKKRPEFLRIAKANVTAKTATMLIQCHASTDIGAPNLSNYPSPTTDCQGIRVGFTASRRVGNAVKRNRAKRRLRALVNQILSGYLESIADAKSVAELSFVFIAVPATTGLDFSCLIRDLKKGVKWCVGQIRLRLNNVSFNGGLPCPD